MSRIPLDNFSFLPSHNLLYCRIQKAGSSSWLEGTLPRMVASNGMVLTKNNKRAELVSKLRIRKAFKIRHFYNGAYEKVNQKVFY